MTSRADGWTELDAWVESSAAPPAPAGTNLYDPYEADFASEHSRRRSRPTQTSMEYEQMKEHEIIAAVEQTAKFDDHEHARRAVQVTLSVLGERLSGGETQDLAAQLPPNFADALPPSGRGDRFDLAEFYRLVAVREGGDCTLTGARQHARAVMSVLRNGVTPGEFDDVVQQLPDEYADLLDSPPVLH